MIRRIDHNLFRGFINPKLRMTITYGFKDDLEKYRSFDYSEQYNRMTVYPEHALNISTMDGRIFISTGRYFQFILLLDKSIKLISEHLYELYPSITKTEFEMDYKALQIFQTEKALSSGGFIITPDIWVNDVSETFPALKIEAYNGMVVKVPLEDAMAMCKILDVLDPYNLGIALFNAYNKMRC